MCKVISIISLILIVPTLLYGKSCEENWKYATELMSKYYTRISVDNNGGVSINIYNKKFVYPSEETKEFVTDGSISKFLIFGDDIKAFTVDSSLLSVKSLLRISKCTKIQHLGLYGDVTDEYQELFQKLSDLNWVTISGSISKSNLEVISKIKTMEALTLIKCPVSDNDVVAFDGMVNLKTLHLSNTLITDKAIEILSKQKHPNLEFLDLGGTAITDACAEYLLKMPQLKTIIVIGSKVTCRAMEKLQQKMPHCEIIYK